MHGSFVVLLTLWSLARSATILTCRVKENLPINTTICNVYALFTNASSTAPDCNVVQCDFSLGLRNDNPHFVINTHGVVTTRRLLDREALRSPDNPAVVDLVFMISVGMNVYQAQLTILVDDENDNTPTFLSPQESLHLKEDTPQGIRRFIQRAVDEDAGANGNVTYEIVSGNDGGAFRLVAETAGVVYLTPAKSLDRETLDHYLLNISARDGGRPARSSYHLVNVTIVDANDNDPVFLRKDYSMGLEENSPADQLLFQASAVDYDLGRHAAISYFILSESRREERHFTINPMSGIVRTTALSFDYDSMERSVHVFWLYARDNGSAGGHPRTAETEVTVSIIDVNDEAPEIKLSFPFLHLPDGNDHHYSLWEDGIVGTLLADVLLKDPDRQRGKKTHVTAKLEGGDGFFIYEQVGSGTGSLKVGKSLDYETRNTYNLKLIASDNDTPSLTSEYPLKISVLDRNDNPPIFERSNYSGVAMENAVVGERVVRVHANDRDSGINADVYYHIVSGSDWFSINTTTGWVKVAKPADRELSERVTLLIEASNEGVPRMASQVNVTIQISDDNDMTPVFESGTYSFDLDENQPIGTSIGRVKATDNDIGKNAFIQYKVHNNHNFGIEETSGIIRSKEMLDYEETHEHTFEVIAYDGGVPRQSSSVMVTVTVNDRNDNAPVFQNTNPMFVSMSQLNTNKTLVRVNAIDRDTKDGGRVTYNIYYLGQGHFNDLFGINEETGVVSTLHPLLHVKPQELRYVITATDNGDEIQRSSEIELIIKVKRPGGEEEPVVDVTSEPQTKSSDESGITTIIVVLIAVLVVMLAILVIVAVIFLLRTQNQNFCSCKKFGFEEEGKADLKSVARRSSSRVQFAVEDDVREFAIQFEYEDKERVEPEGENSPDKEENAEIHVNMRAEDKHTGRSRKPLQVSDQQELQREADEDSDTESTDSGHHTADSVSTPMSGHTSLPSGIVQLSSPYEENCASDV